MSDSPDHDEAMAAYGRDASMFLDEAIKGGDVQALFQARRWTTSGYQLANIGIMQRDPYKALVYGAALRELLDPRRAQQIGLANSKLLSEVGAERAEAARREGEALRAAYFAEAKPIDALTDDNATDAADCWK